MIIKMGTSQFPVETSSSKSHWATSKEEYDTFDVHVLKLISLNKLQSCPMTTVNENIWFGHHLLELFGIASTRLCFPAWQPILEEARDSSLHVFQVSI